MWRRFCGEPVGDIAREVRALMARGRCSLHVGTDSKQREPHADFVTVVAVLEPGWGGRIFYRHLRTPRSRSLAEKLFYEVELSLSVAAMLVEADLGPITVHVDANEDVRHESSRYVQSLSGMVRGYGFPVRVKPEAWCATHVADLFAKASHPRAA